MRTPQRPGAKTRNPLSRLPTFLHVSDLQGLAQLATQGVLGVAGLAEAVQGNVYKKVAAPFGPLGIPFVDRTPGSSGVRRAGITGLVYGGVKGVARLAGGAANAVLARAAPLVGNQPSSREREAVLAALNGVLGDRLLDTGNPLTISMSFRLDGQPLVLDKAALAQQLPLATGKVMVMLHGLCMNDLQWASSTLAQQAGPALAGGQSHADVLARELGYTPVYLHYNSGLHTSVNGAQLSALLARLVAAWPVDLSDLSLLCHSMGGLVARSACHQAELSNAAWREKLVTLIFLGTPHHGAPLERLGNWVDTALGRYGLTRPFASIGQIRSSGITDLRYGHVLTSSWQGQHRFDESADQRVPLPLPAVNCFAIAGTRSNARPVAGSADPATPVGELAGDGLVPLASALGQHAEHRHTLEFAPERQWIAYGVNHMALLKSPEVTAQLVRWLSVI